MDERLPRKLAAILYADVADYSRLTGEDEDATHRRLSEYLDCVSNEIGKHHGEVVHYAGDAVLADFGTVTNALECATAVQSELSNRNRDLPDDRKIQFRIGINLGEVIVDRGDIYGNDVNVAARLESLADAGGICISEAVRTAIGNKLPVAYEFMGEQTVKNIKDPVRAYQVRLHPREQSQEQPRALHNFELPQKPSIAVLPFANMNADPEQEFFSDGITEDIITALSKIDNLMVIAGSSTSTYKGKAVDVRQVSREQGVRYVLEGSVRKAANRVRVSYQLIDAVSGLHKHADRFDRELDDIFEVQDEITRQVTIELQVQLTSGEQARLWAGGTNNVAAWELALKADDLSGRHIREENLQARACAEKAVSLDPEYAAAWSALGLTHWEDARWGWSKSKDASLEKAEAAAREAERIDPDYPGTYSLLGLIFLSRGQHDESMAMMEKAVDLAPNHAASVALYALGLHMSMRPDEGIRQMKRAMRLSPVYPFWYLVPLAGCHLINAEPKLACEALNRAIEKEPDTNLPRIWLTAALAEMGHSDESKRQALQVLKLEPDFSTSAWSSGLDFKDASWTRKLEQNLRDAGLPD